MRSLLANVSPLGRLYEPLRGLAARVHRVLGARHKTVWANDRGDLFMDNEDGLSSLSKCMIVGTYDTHTPLIVIENALRLALRERARSWITDWKTPRKEYSLRPEHAGARTATARQGSDHWSAATDSSRVWKLPAFVVRRRYVRQRTSRARNARYARAVDE